MQKHRELSRDDSRLIIHFDYDCFYASVVENEDPALRSLPLAIQQKQIIVTCNYEARRRGLYKLQLITEAKRVCPDVIIVLGEDISRFRNASKDLYNFLRDSIWSDRAEKLGFDEVWLDCTDMVEYNLKLLNPHTLTQSFFCTDKDDPTRGFNYDATTVFGPTFPPKKDRSGDNDDVGILNGLTRRLCLASHLARHLRHNLESQKGYTATVGIATNKLLSKLVGNVNKPKNQTTIMPPYEPLDPTISTTMRFIDELDIGKVPGIGFKLAQKIRSKILARPAQIEEGLVVGWTKEAVKVRDVRTHPGMGPIMLEELLGGPGAQRGIGGKIWELLHGIDDTEVTKAKRVPSQISQEDSYMKYIHTSEQVRKQLHLLSDRLIRRMHIDLMEDNDDAEGDSSNQRRWLAHPRTLRLSTRPRPASIDGVRPRTFHRISRSAPLPNFVFSLRESSELLAEKLVDYPLLDMFRKLHPEKHGWNLSLINIAVTNMAETAAETKDSDGRDIGRMFRRQDDVLKDFKVREDSPRRSATPPSNHVEKDSDFGEGVQCTWNNEEETNGHVNNTDLSRCEFCQATIPEFAMVAHKQFHENLR